MARQYSLKKVVSALRTHHGLISLAADMLGCSRSTVYAYINAYPEVAAVVEEERERMVDMAENALYHHLEDRSPWAISLVLRTLGKHRGYGNQLPSGSRVPEDDELAEWSAIQATLLEALKAYPEAKLAIVEALNNGHAHESTNGHSPSA